MNEGLVWLIALAMIVLGVAILILTRSLVTANKRAYDAWEKATEHALAINVHERDRLRLELERDTAEFMLHEARRKAGAPEPSTRDRVVESPHTHDDVVISHSSIDTMG